MITATKVKLYPNEMQKVLLEKHFGSCRFVYIVRRVTFYTINCLTYHGQKGGDYDKQNDPSGGDTAQNTFN